MEFTPAPTQIMLNHREIVEAIIKARGIREGTWALTIVFGHSAACIPQPNGELLPASIAPVLSIGIQRSNVKNNLTVDAAAVASPIILPNGLNGR